MTHQYSKDPLVQRALRHSLRDAAAFSVMSGGGETYFSAFAILLKASTTQIAWLASLPPLLGSFSQLVSAWLGRYGATRTRLIVAGAALQVCIWPFLIALPLLYPAHAVSILIGCVTLYYAMSHFIAPQWSSLMGDLVPERRRGRFFARRTRIASVAAFAAVVAAGSVLDRFDAMGNIVAGFVVIFSTAALARVVSVYHLSRLVEPRVGAAPATPLDVRDWWRRLRRSRFVHFSLFVATMQFAVGIASPFFTVHMLRDLQFSYLQFMANTATVVLMQILTLNTWGRLSDAFGNRLILVLTGSLIPVLPSLWLVSDNFWYLMGVQVLGGLSWAGFSLSSGNFLYDLVPSAKRSTYLAYHNVLVAGGVFLGALLGGYLATALPRVWSLAGHTLAWSSGLYAVFLVSSGVRALVAVLFLPRLREVRSVRPMSVRRLVFRVARYNALSGLIFDVVTMFRRAPGESGPSSPMVSSEGDNSSAKRGLRGG